ncbi:hypothetical protein SCLCIDRAFT_126081, partial [Scleroderma citrinum Foug A]
SPSSMELPCSWYDFAIISQTNKSDWPSNGLRGHAVVQICLIFCLLHSNTFLAYIYHFKDSLPPSRSTNNDAAGLHILKRAIRSDGTHVGDVIPLLHLRSPAHVIPCFGKEANPRLTCHTAYELSNEFWLNKYWNKEFFYALSHPI